MQESVDLNLGLCHSVNDDVLSYSKAVILGAEVGPELTHERKDRQFAERFGKDLFGTPASGFCPFVAR